MAIKGPFRPHNPEKYKGDPTKIIYRSSYELKLLRELDVDPNVEWYQSEERSIPYHDPTRGHLGRYFPDMIVKYKEPAKTVVIEIKPLSQTKPPVRGKNQRTFIKEALTYAKNLAKWEAAKRWCEQRGYEFKIMTERELNIPIFESKKRG